jgi:hypothetical protein
MKTNQASGLYPIIRRVRRPLLSAEATADAKAAPAVVPVQAEQNGAASGGEQRQQGKKRGQVTPVKPAE